MRVRARAMRISWANLHGAPSPAPAVQGTRRPDRLRRSSFSKVLLPPEGNKTRAPRVSFDVRWSVVGSLVLVACARPMQAPPVNEENPAVAAEPVEEPRPAEPLFDDARIDWTRNGVMRVVGRMSQKMTSTGYWRGGGGGDRRQGIY